jgi:hypothetical protein
MDALKQKIRRILRRHFSERQERMFFANGFEDCIHLYVVSPRFKGKRPREIGKMIWPSLFANLTPEEWGRVTLTKGLTPDQVNGVLKTRRPQER